MSTAGGGRDVLQHAGRACPSTSILPKGLQHQRRRPKALAIAAAVSASGEPAQSSTHMYNWVVEQMMQQEAMRVRLHGQPAAEPPYADFFAWAGQQPAAARGGGGG